jgi:hypothetical protein
MRTGAGEDRDLAAPFVIDALDAPFVEPGAVAEQLGLCGIMAQRYSPAIPPPRECDEADSRNSRIQEKVARPEHECADHAGD